MLPHRGQGLNHAVADAHYLVDAIISVTHAERTLEEAITAYEAEMRPRGTKEVALSFQQAEMTREQDTWKKSPLAEIGLTKVE